jgi:hypothetical protein
LNWLIIIFLALLKCATAFSQGGNTGNISNPNAFLGWNGIGLAPPLNIRNDFNQNINIFRNGLNRMQFQTENWTGLNGLNVPNANRIMIELENSNVVAAWSMLHLRDGGVSQFMRRDWFNVGTTFDTAVDLGFQRLGCH